MKTTICLGAGILCLVLFSPVQTSSDKIDIETYFCPEDTCEEVLFSFISSAESSLHCAIYDVDNEELLTVLTNLSERIIVKVVTEKKNGYFDKEFISYDTNFALMHNKFCVVDEQKVLTGSTNPTKNGLYRNNNDIVIIQSKDVAKVFLQEFYEIKIGEDGAKSTSNSFENVTIYFCPEDNCRDVLIQEIRSAKETIQFATFAFTDPAIATELLLAKERGVQILGVVENRMFTSGVAPILAYHNISVSRDVNKATMHHKLFVFDEQVVLTGSYNPTKNGNLYNDENMLILREEGVVKAYVNHLRALFSDKNI